MAATVIAPVIAMETALSAKDLARIKLRWHKANIGEAVIDWEQQVHDMKILVQAIEDLRNENARIKTTLAAIEAVMQQQRRKHGRN